MKVSQRVAGSIEYQSSAEDVRVTGRRRSVFSIAICCLIGSFRLRFVALAAINAIAWPLGGALAQTNASDFFTGKTVTLVVGSAAGTGYDTYARLFARFLPQHLPGHPTVVVENMLGVSGLKAAYYIYNVAAADGTIIALGEGTLPAAPLMTPSAAQFRRQSIFVDRKRHKRHLYKLSLAYRTCANVTDAKNMDVVVGGISAGSPSVNLAIISNALFSTRFKIISGYSSTGEMNLAMQRGEIQGTFVNTYSALKSQEPAWIKDGQIRVILQQGFERKIPTFPTSHYLSIKPPMIFNDKCLNSF